jgi:HEAT repeat protein
MYASDDDLKQWLRARPFQDNPDMAGLSVPETPHSWQEWIKRAKQLPDLEKRLVLLLQQDKDPVNRSAAAVALGFVGSDASLKPLIKVLKNDLPLVGMEAAAALGRLGKSEATDPLCEALVSPDPNVRANALLALGRLGGERAVACVRNAAEKENDPFVQAAAQKALLENQ